MTLTEFLSTADADDTTALAEAHAYTETQGKLVSRNMVNSILAQNGMYNALLTAASSDDLIAAFMDASSTQYNFIEGDSTGDAQIAALDALITGDFPELAALKRTLIELCNIPFNPFSDATIEQVKAIRYPVTSELCTHPAGMNYVVSASNRDLFSFVSTLTDDCTGIDVSIKWREDAAEAWKVFNVPVRLQGGNAGETLSQVIARPRGIQNARHFEFSYKGQYAGQVSSVSVNVSQ